jgi:hypothetical protein
MMRAGRRLVVPLALLGCLLVPGSKATAFGAEPLDDRLGVRTPLVFLLIRSDIQKDLSLEPTQIAEANRFAAELYRRALLLKGKAGPGVVAARRAIDEAGNDWLSKHLTPEQRERLGQIDLQWEGVSALLSRPVVIDFLGMTDEQRDQVSRVFSDRIKARGGQGPWTYEEHLEITRKAIAVLTDKQKHLWAKVLGRPCRFVIGADPRGEARPAGAQKPNDNASRG